MCCNVLPKGWMCSEEEFYVNPTGRFVIGGPDGDAASPAARSSSTPMAVPPPTAAAPSRARIPTKVDRSAAYAARYLAKNVVAAGLAERCTIQLSYAIGVSKPLSVYVDTHGTGEVDEDKLVEGAAAS